MRLPAWLVADIEESHPDALGSLDLLQRNGRPAQAVLIDPS